MQPSRVTAVGAFLAVFVAVLITSSLLTVTLGPSVTYRATISYSSAQIREEIQVWSRYAADIGRGDYLMGSGPPISTIYYYYDHAYPTSFSDDLYWFGLSQLIVQLATERGMPISVVLLTAPELRQFLQQPPPSGSLLVMASGVLPETVFGPGLNEPIQWLREGGVMVWAGDVIGAYSGAPAQNGGPPVTVPVGLSGIAQFLNLSYLGSGGLLYQNQSTYSSTFDFVYSLGLPGQDEFDVGGVDASGGTALGPQASGYTNLAVIPEGSGRLIDFAGPLWDLNAFVQTMMNGIQSGAFLFPLHILGNQTVPLPAGQNLDFLVTYTVLPSAENDSLTRFCSFAFESGQFAQFTQLSCTSLS